MLPVLLSLTLHAAGWAIIALFAVRLIGWYPRGCRLLFLGLGLDLLSLSVWYFPTAARNLGLPFWNILLGPIGLRPGMPQLALLTVVGASLLELCALAVLVRAFVGACRAAEELRFASRSATDRILKDSDARSPDRRFDNAAPNPR